MVTEVALVAAGKIKKGEFTRIEGTALHALNEETLYFYLPATVKLSPYTEMTPFVQGALFAESALGKAYKLTIDVSAAGTPYDTRAGSQSGPQSVYGKNNEFVLFDGAGGMFSVFWQDYAKNKLYLTSLDTNLSVKNMALPVSSGVIGTCTTDPDGNLYYLTLGTGSDPVIQLVKTDSAGKLIKKRTLSNSQSEFNVYAFGDVVNLQYADGKLGMVLARTMQKSADGLNHQGSIAVVFDANDLSTLRNYGQNSGHSFNNRVIADGNNFITMTLGDNYPRGIVVHKVSDKSIEGKVVYTFKTAHGRDPSPYRKGENGKPLPAGKWSNDNYTYTDFGDIAKGDGGYGVLFASEKTADNALAKSQLNEPRNLGFVLLALDFQTKKQDSLIVSDEVVISKGTDSAEFGFYTFDGWFSKQQYRGVIWLTAYTDKNRDNAVSPKMVYLGGGRYLALWEKWTNNTFKNLCGCVFDEKGNLLIKETDLGALLRLGRGERIILSGSRVLWITASNSQLELNILELYSK